MCESENYAPSFILQYIHLNHVMVFEDWVLTDGLGDQSVSFWMYLLGRETGKFLGLLNIVLAHGDYETKCMANAFYQDVSLYAIPRNGRDVYQAMLIRFHFSPHCTDALRKNYERMVLRPMEAGVHVMHALLDCGHSQLIAQFAACRLLSLYPLKEPMIKINRLGDSNSPLFMKHYTCWDRRAPLLLKTLIRQWVDGLYIQTVWDWIQSSPRL